MKMIKEAGNIEQETTSTRSFFVDDIHKYSARSIGQLWPTTTTKKATTTSSPNLIDQAVVVVFVIIV